jgi:hypothetical protein
MDFYGGGAENTPTPRLYKGFIELKWPTFQILAGQDWDTHSSLYPTMVNFGYLGDSGNIQFRRPQLRLTKLFPFLETSRVTLAAAIARTISGDQDGFGKNDGDDSGIPTLEGRLAYENQRAGSVPFMVAASGHYGKQEIDWDESGTDTEYKSWSANGELMVPLWGDRLSLKGEYFYGSNLDAYYGGIGQGINKATRQAIRATGGWGEFTVKPFVRTLLHLGAGVDHPKGGNLVTGDRSQNFSTFANVSYDVFSFLTLAFEYSHWRTSYKDGATSTDNRYHTALIMNF